MLAQTVLARQEFFDTASLGVKPGSLGSLDERLLSDIGLTRSKVRSMEFGSPKTARADQTSRKKKMMKTVHASSIIISKLILWRYIRLFEALEQFEEDKQANAGLTGVEISHEI